ncbi:MAG: type IV pilus assembly protein PilB [Parcubacteria group bacterium Gr01-1014_33]|nr:MAG: type IV pilus assembly protein PilB [Parcubacteria group bacterium Gr01-1014_33]
MHLLETELKQVLIDSGLVAGEEFDTAKKEAARSGREVLDVLIGTGVVTEEYAKDYIAAFFHVPSVDLEKTDIDPHALELVPEMFAKTHRLIIFAFDAGARAAKAAMADPEDLGTIEYLRAKLDCWIEPYITTPKSLRHGINQYKRKLGEEFNATIQENIKKTLTESGVSDAARLAESVPTITILDSIVEHAVTLGASDIHFEPFEKELLVRFRIDGIMHEIVKMPKEIAPIIVARVKVISGLQIDIHNAPQDGRFRFSMEDKYADIRVSILPTFYGEKAEMRILQGAARPLTLTELGMSDKELKQVEEVIKRPHGMFLVTGPTGSGKTTTLYSVLHILNTPEVSINTVEDPIEYNVPGVTQTQVNIKAGITFATGLRALVRQNPNIIMIGEIRDSETADIAINAALTGHLVLSTLHTNDAAGAIPRLTDMRVEVFLIASTVDVVIAQRLIRKICSVCVQSFEPDARVKSQLEDQARLLGVHEPHTPSLLFRGKGCALCNFTGYRGQIGIFEVLRVTDAIRNLILKRSPTNEIKKEAIGEGMALMFEDGLKKAEAGITTLEEVMRVTKE